MSHAELKKLFLESREILEYFDMTDAENQYNLYLNKLNEIKDFTVANPSENNPWENQIAADKEGLKRLLRNVSFSIHQLDDLQMS